MKSHPPGTRWAVRVGSTRWVAKFDQDSSTSVLTERAIWSHRSVAMCLVWQWRASFDAANNDAGVRLVRISPKRPRRTVEERIAKAVDGRTKQIRDWARLAQGLDSRTRKELCAFLDTLPHAGDGPPWSPANVDIHDGKVTTALRMYCGCISYSRMAGCFCAEPRHARTDCWGDAHGDHQTGCPAGKVQRRDGKVLTRVSETTGTVFLGQRDRCESSAIRSN